MVRSYQHHNHAKNGTHTPTYRSWHMMKQRCTNKKYTGYLDYGGRGITVCSQWVNSYVTFLHDMGERPSIKFSLDRIDVNGNYEPSNCRWATQTQQNLNTRTPVTNTSGIKGVSWSEERKKWEAKIQIHGKTINLGRFSDKEDAKKARLNAEQIYKT